MSSSFRWLVMTSIFAAIFHVGLVCYYPVYKTEKTVEEIFKRRGSRQMNQIRHGTLRSAGTDIVARDNPDTLTSFAVYDVAEKPVKVHCVVPDSENYWSLSLFAWNTDNFFVVNDRTAKSKEFDLVIANAPNQYQKQGQEKVVISPTTRGVLIIRMIVTDRDAAEEISKLTEIQSKTFFDSRMGTEE